MNHFARVLIGITALAGFLASLAVHVTSLMGTDVEDLFPYVWLLHAGIFVVFVPFFIVSRKDFDARPSLAKIKSALPRWVSVLGTILFAYAIVNFLLFVIATDGGNPAIRDGKYLLLDHGQLIRELTKPEYIAMRANETRGFSGHWLLFYFTAAAYFLGYKSNNSFKAHPLRGSP